MYVYLCTYVFAFFSWDFLVMFSIFFAYMCLVKCQTFSKPITYSAWTLLSFFCRRFHGFSLQSLGSTFACPPPWALRIALYFNFINYSQKPLPWTLPDLRWQLKTADFLSAWHTAYRLDYIWYLIYIIHLVPSNNVILDLVIKDTDNRVPSGLLIEFDFKGILARNKSR